MPQPTGPSYVSRHDWRSQTGKRRASRARKRIKAAVLGLLACLLLALLVYWLWPARLPGVDLAYLPIRQSNIMISPVPFLEKDIEAFEQLKERPVGKQAGVRVQVFPDEETLRTRLQDCRENLILLVSGHGVSHDGKAYLLSANSFSGGDPLAAGEAPYELGEFLALVARCPAKRKLLLLDVGHIPREPWLGMIVNEFPRLLEKELEELRSPGLRVLTANAAFERSHPSYAFEQSLFTYYVTQGLDGAADAGEEDGVVELDELFRFVRNGVAQSVKEQTDGTETQTPLLFGYDADKGEVVRRPEAGIFLVKLPPPEAEAESEAAPATEETGSETKPAEGTKGESRDTKPKSPAGKEAPDAAKPEDAGAEGDLGREKGKAAAGNGPDGQSTPNDARSGQEPLVANTNTNSNADADADADTETSSTEGKTAPAEAAGQGGQEARPAGGAPESPKTAGASAGAAGPDRRGAKETPLAAAQEPARAGPERRPQAALPAGTGQVHQLLERGWQRRDEMLRRAGPGTWTPVDYAPHLCRHFQELLLGYELWHRCGRDFSAGQMAELKRLVEGGIDVLERAENGFLSSPALRSYREAEAKYPNEVKAVEEAIQLRNDLLFAAPYYVRWHARAAMSGQNTPLFTRLPELFEELATLVRLLESLEQGDSTAASRPPDPIGELETSRRKLETLRASIEEDLLKARAEQLKGEAFQGRSEAGSQTAAERIAHQIDGLLCTPLLAGQLRMDLLQAFDAMGRVASSASQETAPPAAQVAGAPPAADQASNWDRLREQAILEVRLVRLVDPDVALPSASGGGSLDPEKLLPPNDATEEDQLWQDYRKLGRMLGDFYQSLPDRVDRTYDPGKPAEMARLGRLLFLVDARDATKIESEDVGSLALPRVDWDAVVRPSLELRVADESILLGRSRDWSEPVTATILCKGSLSGDALVRFEHLKGPVEVEGLSGKRIRDPDRWQIPLRPGGSVEFPFRVRLEEVPEGESSFDLRMVVELGGLSEAVNVRLHVPPPDHIDLVVERILDQISGATSEESGTREGVVCRAFPGRKTEYRLMLKKYSQEPRKVTVQLLRAKKRQPPDLAARKGPLDSFGRVLEDQFEPVTDPLPVELLAGDKPCPITFPKPEAPEKQEGVDGQEKEKPLQGTDDRPLITEGLVCLIRETPEGQPEKTWTRWLDFELISPDRYLQPDVSYEHSVDGDPSRGAIQIVLKPLEESGILPPVSPETPIEVQWENAGEFLQRGSNKVTAAKLQGTGSRETLKGTIDLAQTSRMEVCLTVDRYPRAFVYQFDCDQDLRQILPARDLRRIQITAPEDGQVYKVPFGAEGIQLDFRVDAPSDSFQQRREEDVVKAGIVERQGDPFNEAEGMYFEATRPRQVHIRLDELSPQGILRIDTEVGDFQVELNPGDRLAGASYHVLAQLLIGGEVDHQDSRRVVLDGDAPSFRRVEPGRWAVPQGGTLRVTVEVDDTSGLRLLEVGFDVDENGKLEGEEKLDELTNPEGDRWEFELSTEKLKDKLKPERSYPLLVCATDKADHPMEKSTVDIRIEPAIAKAKTGGQAGATTTIRGRIYYKSPNTTGPWVGPEVRLEELGLTATPDMLTGEFVFKAVPLGQYTLRAKAIFANTRCEGSSPVAATAEPVRVEIRME